MEPSVAFFYFFTFSITVGKSVYATSDNDTLAGSGAARQSQQIGGLGKHLRTINIDSHFPRWPDKNQILFYFDPFYTDQEKELIRDAARTVAFGTQNCVNFVETTAEDTRYKVKVTPIDSTFVLGGRQICFSYPGKATFTPNNEQNLLITHGQYGCLDKHDISDIMSYWAILLGRRNEHQRGDRDKYITMNPQNHIFPTAYRLYGASEAYWSAFPYDFCSITHNIPTEFAIPGTTAFSINSDPKAIPTLPYISNTDCQLISLMYGCDRSLCQPLDCTAARQQALQQQQATTPTTQVPKVTTVPTSKATSAATTTTMAPPTTTPIATTTTPGSVCSPQTFCSKSPDESSFLLGPFQQFQTYLLFSGSCVMEYLMDFTTGTLQQQLAPQLITEYFPPPGGPSMVPPITLAYLNLDTSGTSFQLNLQNQLTSKMLQCLSNPAVFTKSSVCPTAAVSAGIISSGKVTSATSQLSLGDGQVYHLAVDFSGTNLNLMDTQFATTYQTTNGFLTGQSSIAKITAIQLVQDGQGINPQMLVVFGTGSDNATPYVGFVHMPLDGSNNVPLTPIEWTAEPLPLKSVLKGC